MEVALVRARYVHPYCQRQHCWDDGGYPPLEAHRICSRSSAEDVKNPMLHNHSNRLQLESAVVENEQNVPRRFGEKGECISGKQRKHKMGNLQNHHPSDLQYPVIAAIKALALKSDFP